MEENKKDPAVTSAMTCFVVSFFVAAILGLFFESILVGVITIVIGLYASFKILVGSVHNSTSSDMPDEPSARKTTSTKPRPKHATFDSRVAGAQYHCDDSDIGGFLGYIEPEPNNEYDKNAIAIYSNDGKHLGYIPKGDTARVRRWASRESLPCIGFILDGDEVAYWGRIVIVDADAKRTELEMVKCAIEMVERDGIDILPPEFRTEGDDQPKTKKEWLQVLQDYIAEHE